MEIIKIEDVFGELAELETPRLLLRKFKAEDAADMFEYASDEETAKYVTWSPHRTIEDSRGFIDLVLGKYAAREVAEWGVVLKENGKFIGTCGYVWWKPGHAKAEIGYALSRKYWGRGLMSEALAAVMAFGFDKMRLQRLELQCMPENIGSEKVMLKNGLKLEGVLRDVIYAKGTFQTLKLYSILRSEYRPA